MFVDGSCLNNHEMDLSKRKSHGAIYGEGGKPAIIFPLPDAKTNNEAEYGAVIYALEYLMKEGKTPTLELLSDSQLVVNQINFRWEVKKTELMVLMSKVRDLIANYRRKSGKGVTLSWVRRNKNPAGMLLEENLQELRK